MMSHSISQEGTEINFTDSLLAAGVAGIYVYLKSTLDTLDKASISNALENAKTEKTISDEIMRIDAFSAMLDKPAHYKKAASLVIDACTEDGTLSETMLFETLDSLVCELGDDDRISIYNVVVMIVGLDKKVDAKEKEFLVQFAEHFDLKKDVIDIINQCLVVKARRREKWLAVGLSLIIVVVAGIVACKYLYPNPPDVHFGKLVFDKINFSRYVVAGNFSGGSRNKHLGKAAVYYINGYADVQFDFDHLSLQNCTRLHGYSSKADMTCEAIFSMHSIPLSNALPYEVAVTLQSSTEAMRVDPTPISNDEAKKIGITAGLIAGVGGAYIGARVGAQSGGLIGKMAGAFSGVLPGPVSKITSLIAGPVGAIALGGVGAAVAGGALGTIGYVVTKNLIAGISLTKHITEKDKENVIEMAKRLTAADLMSPKLSKRYKKGFEKTIHELYRPYGIAINGIHYE